LNKYIFVFLLKIAVFTRSTGETFPLAAVLRIFHINDLEAVGQNLHKRNYCISVQFLVNVRKCCFYASTGETFPLAAVIGIFYTNDLEADRCYVAGVLFAEKNQGSKILRHCPFHAQQWLFLHIRRIDYSFGRRAQELSH
jgi:hypothetical protein